MPLNAGDLARRRLLVGHDGGDQVVEIDVLDVEGLAHVVAAVAQKLDDLGLVRDRIELGFDRVRPGRDQAQREGRREDLNENRFHEV